MKRYGYVLRAVCIIPYCFILSLTAILMPVQLESPFVDVFWDCIFGKISAGELTTITLSLESIGAVFLFCLLFGDYVAQYFGSVSVYIFTRIRDRRKWAMRKICGLLGYALMFSLLDVLFKIFEARIQVADWGNMADTWKAIIASLLLLFLLVSTVAILVNFWATRFGVAVGVVVALVVIVLLDLIAISYFDNVVNQLLNPLCFNESILQKPILVLVKLLISASYPAALALLYAETVKRMDIF